MERGSILEKSIGNLFSLSKLKIVYLRPFLSSLSIPKFQKQTFRYCRRKRVEIGPSCFT